MDSADILVQVIAHSRADREWMTSALGAADMSLLWCGPGSGTAAMWSGLREHRDESGVAVTVPREASQVRRATGLFRDAYEPRVVLVGKTAAMEFADEIDRLRRYTTPTVVRAVTQAMGQVPLMTNGSLRPLFGDRQATVGRAVTATLSPVESAQPRAAIAADILEFLNGTAGPVIAVVHDATGDAGCIWDKATTQLAASVGCVGIVTDGEATDVVAVEATGLLILANGPTLPNYFVELTDISSPVEVGGLHVEAGDIIHADRHGATVVPEDLVHVLPKIADALLESHTEFLDWLNSGRRSPSEISDHFRAAADRPQSERNKHWWRRS